MAWQGRPVLYARKREPAKTLCRLAPPVPTHMRPTHTLSYEQHHLSRAQISAIRQYRLPPKYRLAVALKEQVLSPEARITQQGAAASRPCACVFPFFFATARAREEGAHDDSLA